MGSTLYREPSGERSFHFQASMRQRDEDLRSSRFFDVKQFPTMIYHATERARRKAFGLMTDLWRESGGVLLGKDNSITVDAKAILQR